MDTIGKTFIDLIVNMFNYNMVGGVTGTDIYNGYESDGTDIDDDGYESDETVKNRRTMVFSDDSSIDDELSDDESDISVDVDDLDVDEDGYSIFEQSIHDIIIPEQEHEPEQEHYNDEPVNGGPNEVFDLLVPPQLQQYVHQPYDQPFEEHEEGDDDVISPVDAQRLMTTLFTPEEQEEFEHPTVHQPTLTDHDYFYMADQDLADLSDDDIGSMDDDISSDESEHFT